MVIFSVQVGEQVSYFEAASYEAAARAAVAAQLPAHLIKGGRFFTRHKLGDDSKAQALLDGL